MMAGPNSVELVVAHCSEDLDWMRHLPEGTLVVIYSKGEPLRPPVPACVWPLPNVGREAGSYLYHICAHYRELADVTLFLQGDPRPHYPLDDLLTQIADLQLSSPYAGYVPLAGGFAVDDRNGQPNNWRYPIPVGDVYERVFQRPAPGEFRFAAGAQFAATREAIWRKPWAWWQEVLQLCETEYPSIYPWALERLWPLIIRESLPLSV